MVRPPRTTPDAKTPSRVEWMARDKGHSHAGDDEDGDGTNEDHRRVELAGRSESDDDDDDLLDVAEHGVGEGGRDERQ
eukprot:1440867-Prymnesium_polylepis.1